MRADPQERIFSFPSVSPHLQPPGPSPFRTHGSVPHIPSGSLPHAGLRPLPAPCPVPPSMRTVPLSADKALPRLEAPRPGATLLAPPQSDYISLPHPPSRTQAAAGPGRSADPGAEQRSGGGDGLPTSPRTLAPPTRPRPVAAADATPPPRRATLRPARSARPFPGKPRSRLPSPGPARLTPPAGGAAAPAAALPRPGAPPREAGRDLRGPATRGLGDCLISDLPRGNWENRTLGNDRPHPVTWGGAPAGPWGEGGEGWGIAARKDSYIQMTTDSISTLFVFTEHTGRPHSRPLTAHRSSPP